MDINIRSLIIFHRGREREKRRGKALRSVTDTLSLEKSTVHDIFAGISKMNHERINREEMHARAMKIKRNEAILILQTLASRKIKIQLA